VTKSGTGTDAELLTEFVSAGSETPFEVLVERHGPLVLGVCRRVLGEHAEAEDAAQAVFLTLAHKARTLRRHPSLAAWLHRVARHISLRAREARDLRRRREGEAGEMVGKTEETGAEGLLDGELDALPEKYRSALILRYMQGLTEEQASEALGVRTGTLSARLSRGRELLKQRIERKGATLSTTALAGLLAGATEIEVPVAFAAGTAKAAALALAGQAAAAGVVATNVVLLTKGALNAMFWAKVKVAAAVLGTAAVASAGVPVAVRAVVAAEKEPVAPAAAPAAREEVLEFRRLEVPQRWKGVSRESFFAAAWSPELLAQNLEDRFSFNYARMKSAEKIHMPAAVRKWALGLKIDYGKEMVLAAFKGISSGSSRYTVEKIVEKKKGLHVEIKFVQGRTRDLGYPYDMVVCPSRDLPVVFCENGKEVARVPFKAGDDKELTGFVDKVRHSSLVGVGTYEGTTGAVPPNSHLGVETVLFGQRQAADRFGADFLDRSWAELKQRTAPTKGDRVLFCVPQGESFGILIKHTPAREKAVKFALAPGWQWTERSFRCPWCRGKAIKRSKEPKHCISRGLCTTCNRTVGPATRGVKLELATRDPRAKTRLTKEQIEDARAGRVRIGTGEAPSLWLSVKSKAREVPEVITRGGHGNLAGCQTLFFLVEGPGRAEPACAFTPALNARRGSRPKALQGSAAGYVTISGGRQVFSRPGSYTVRAVAGRLVSNPVTVIVEQKAPAAGRAPAPPRKAAPARGAVAGPVPGRNPGERTKVAVGAEAKAVLESSEKMLKMLRKIAYDGQSSKLFAESCGQLRQMSARLRGLGRIREADKLTARLEEIVKLRKSERPGPPPKEVF